MARLPVLNGREIRLVLKTDVGPIMDCDLASLYFIIKYGGDNVLLSVHIPESTDEEGLTISAVDYDIVIKEITPMVTPEKEDQNG